MTNFFANLERPKKPVPPFSIPLSGLSEGFKNSVPIPFSGIPIPVSVTAMEISPSIIENVD